MDEKTKELSHVAGFLRREKRELSKAPFFLGPPWTVEVLSASHPREASSGSVVAGKEHGRAWEP